MEGTTSYGASLCSYLMERGYDVFEVLRPKKEKKRVGEGKIDGIDAEHAARAVAAGKGIVPKSHNGWVEGLRTLTVARSIRVNTMTSVSNAIGSPPWCRPQSGPGPNTGRSRERACTENWGLAARVPKTTLSGRFLRP